MQLSTGHNKHTLSDFYSFTAVGDDDTGDAHGGNRRVDRLLMGGVEVCGAFVHDQDFWLPIERPRKQHPLLLTAR